MFVLKNFDGRYAVVGTDSYGYTVNETVESDDLASRFDTRAEAKDILSELDSYWREQFFITTHSSLPF